MAEDRELEVFCIDLFKFLMPKRLGIKNYCGWLRETSEDVVSDFHPHIGMSVLRHSFNTQYCFFLNFLDSRLDTEISEAFILYLTNYTYGLYLSREYNIFEKLTMIASVTLELSVFYFLQGNTELIYFASRFYYLALKGFFRKSFYNNGGGNAWTDLVSDDVRFYEEIELQASDSNKQNSGGSGWLRKLDLWILRLTLRSYSQEMESTQTDSEVLESSDQYDILQCQERALHSEEKTHASELLALKTDKTRHVRLYKIFKDCARRKKYINESGQLIQDLKQIISLNKDNAYKQLSEIIENVNFVNELMRFCIFPDLIDMLKNSKVIMRNEDLLQFVKLILKGNPLMAVYCQYVVQEIYEQLNKKNGSIEGDSERKFPQMAAAKSDVQEANSETKSSEQATPIKGSISSECNTRNTVKAFVCKLMHEKKYGSTEAEICAVLSSENAKTLLNSHIFRNLMRVVINNPNNRWENEWILSIMKLLINVSQTSENFSKHVSTMSNTQKIDCSANEVLNDGANLELTEKVSDSVLSNIIIRLRKPTTSFNTDRESVTTEIVPYDDSNAEKSQDGASNRKSDYKHDSASSVTNQNIKDNLREIIKYPKTFHENRVAHPVKRSVKDSKTKSVSQIAKQSLEPRSPSPKRNKRDIIHAVKPANVMFNEEIEGGYKHVCVSELLKRVIPLTSTQEIYTFEYETVTESTEQSVIPVKTDENEGTKLSPPQFSVLPSKLNANSEEIFDSNVVSQVIETGDKTLINISRVSNPIEFSNVGFNVQKPTVSFRLNKEKAEAHETSKHSAISFSSTNESSNLERQVTYPDTEFLSSKPTFHRMHETSKNQVTDEIDEACNTLPGKIVGSVSEIHILSQDDNSNSKKRAKLESESNIVLGGIIEAEETSNYLKDTNLEDCTPVVNQPTLRSEIIHADDTNLTSQEVSGNTSLKQEKPSPEILSIFENSLSLLPANISSDMSNWILEQIIENNADLLEMMEAKYIIDNQLKTEISKHHNTFKETSEESKAKSDD